MRAAWPAHLSRFDLRSLIMSDEEYNASIVVEQAVAWALVTRRARGRSQVGTSFLDEAFLGFFVTCKTNVRKL